MMLHAALEVRCKTFVFLVEKKNANQLEDVGSKSTVFFFALASSGFSGGNLESIAGEWYGWQKEVNAVIT